MITAYGDRILVQIVEKEKKQGALIIHEEKKDYQIGVVVSIGEALQYDSEAFFSSLKEEDYVYTRKYAGLLIEYDGVEYISLDTKEILAYSEEMK